MNRLRLTIAAVIAGGMVAGLVVSQASSSTSSAGSASATPRLASGSSQDFRGGGRSDAGNYGWALGSTSIAVTRDGGDYWHQVPLPPVSENITGISTLSTEVAVIAVAQGGTTTDIETRPSQAESWEDHSVPVGMEIGPAEVVEGAGTLAGVMINEPSWGGNSRGVWRVTANGG